MIRNGSITTRAVFVFALFSLFQFVASAQIFQPVKWKFSVKPLENNEYEISASAVIDDTWHVYALSVSDKADAIGPIPTTLKLNASPDFELVGKTKEGKYITHFDPNFEMDLNYFEKSASFKQKIKAKSDKPFTLSGVVEYMACNDERCIFPDPELFDLKVTPIATGEEVTVEEAAPTKTAGAKENHTTWSYAIQAVSDQEYLITFTAIMEPEWHIYAQKLESSEGPVPTSFMFDPNADYALDEPATEPKPKRIYDKNFMMNIDYHEGTVVFEKKIKTVGTNRSPITARVDFMQCNDTRCLPPQTVYLKVDVGGLKVSEYDPYANTESTTPAGNDPFKMTGVDLNNPLNNCGQEKENYSLWAIFLFGLIGGLLALLTPCVFPMIPLTVSFFSKGAEKGKGKQRAAMYGFFIFMIYFLLSLPFHLSKNVDPEVLNSIATNTWLNVGFFVVFLVFAISFFGFYEITLPSSLANKVDSASELGGAIGIFFMALTLAIVSFSCTGPILGTVIGSIYSTDIQGVVNFLGLELSMPAAKVSAAMMGFGIALGGPFALFAAFPSLLKKLPKAGGWMDDFKVSLGFMEVALAIKFLSNADLVEQWGIFKRESFFALWIIVGVLWALYMFKVFTFKPGQGSKGWSKFKIVFTSLIVVFTLRLIPGVLPPSELNRFDFLSGFPPPKSYSWYHYEEEFHIYKDLAEAMKAAEEQGKPVFIDFTGWACVNCRKMEDTVWPDETVRAILSEKYIMCSLYVDEKVDLPAEEQFVYTTSDGRKKMIKTVGNKWATLQTETFQNNSQPMYALLSPKGDLLSPIEQYNPDVKKYTEWLNCGLLAFDSWKAK
jgi:thiol:disulfide interchange protein DsbD